MKKIIEYELNFYEFDQDLFESDEIFYERIWYILSNLNKNETIENLIKISRINSNKKYLGCEYELSS